MLRFLITYKPYGDYAVLMQWPEIIDENILKELLFVKKSIENNLYEPILEIVSSYNSLLVVYYCPIENFYDAVLGLKTCVSMVKPLTEVKKSCWTIPVCYDTEVAADLEAYCSLKKMTKEQFVALHSNAIYTTYFIGFLPGFLYLGGLNKQLFISRKAKPSLNVPQGAVAIGGEQTGIYPQDSPGGWYVVGRSPLSFFNVNDTIPCFVSLGDKVRFQSVSLMEYDEIGSLIKSGVYRPKSEIYEG